LILIKLLKLFGLDIPRRIEAVKSALVLRAEEATERAGELAQEAAAIAAFATAASFTGALAIVVGLLALYRWTAENYGPFAGLGIVGGILIVATALLAAIAADKGRSLAKLMPRRHGPALARDNARAGTVREAAYQATHEDFAPASSARNADPDAAAYDAAAYRVNEPAVSADDLIGPLSFFLGRHLRFPSFADPVADELVSSLRVVAGGAMDETVGRAANLIRRGDRTNMIIVLSGAALAGWLLARQAPRNGSN